MRLTPILEVDFLKVKPGVFIAQKDVIGGSATTIFDLRLKKPYEDDVLDTAVIQTIQHIIYDYIIHDELWGSKVISFLPCPSRTAFFLMVKGDLISEEILPLLERAFDYAAEFEGEIPRSKPSDCAYCLDLDLELEATRKVCTEYYNLLIAAKKINLNYPVKRVKKK